MAVIRLDSLESDSLVLHFGGATSINAHTLAEALLGFADASIAISATIDPGSSIEIVVEATGPGSFRTRVRRIRKDYGGLIAVGGTIFWGVVTNLIYDAAFKSDPKLDIVVNTDEVIITHGNDTVIVPRKVHAEAEKAKKNPRVQSALTRTFNALAADEEITDFGITGSLGDSEPLVRIPRTDFPPVVYFPDVSLDGPEERIRKEKARLIVLKPWLNHSKRKWSFEWNGIPLSAPIHDTDFLDRLDRREVLFGRGDVLDVEIMYKQSFDAAIGLFVNDPASFVVTRVMEEVPRR